MAREYDPTEALLIVHGLTMTSMWSASTPNRGGLRR
jgi:hypothetical protein